MKKTLLFLLVFLNISSFSYCQSANALRNFEKGSAAIESKDYQKGIKLLTMSIKEYPSSDAYFNRAAAHLYLGDTCSFCNDLKNASELYDQEASDLYDEKCKYSTIDKNISDSLKAKYHDLKQLEIIHKRCNSAISIVYIFESKENSLISTESSNTNPSPVFSIVENMPSYVGDEEERIRFIDENLRYPESAFMHSVQGTVYVSVIIDSTGIITSAKVIKGIGQECDEEAMRVIGLMPIWIPGKQGGKNVSVMLNIPIMFNIARHRNLEDMYSNKAETNLKAGDTCRFCNDLQTASNLGDRTASMVIGKICVKYETITEAPDSILKEYPGYSYTIISIPKYNSNKVYTYYNRKNECISSIYEVLPEFPGGEIGRMKFL